MHKFSQLTAGILLCASILTAVPLSALSYTGLGEITDIKTDSIGKGLYYKALTGKTEKDKPQKAYIFEYDPAAMGVLPIVRWGSSVYGKDRVGAFVSAANADAQTVFGAVNGDFYSMQTGVPMGIMIDGGRLISSDDSKYALGFFADGSATIGKPSISISVSNITADSEALKVSHFNKYPTIWGAYMLDSEFASTTMSQSDSLEIVIRTDDTVKARGNVSGTVTEITEKGCNTKIPEGCVVISIAHASESYKLFSGFKVGDEVVITTDCADEWYNVVTAVGCGDMILEYGVMPEGIIDEDHEKAAHPRTAVGIKEDGSVLFFAVDGRTSASYGLKIAELSALMAEFGCVHALNLDGGGSTTVSVKPSGSGDTVYVNTPSDGSYRAVSNAILFVNPAASDGSISALSVTPKTPHILRNSTVTFSASALDSDYKSIDAAVDQTALTAQFAKEYGEDSGSFSGASFRAGNTPGEYRIRLTYGTVYGDVSVIVENKLHDLSVSPTYSKVTPGTLVALDIDAIYNGEELLCDSGSFYYTINGEHTVPDPESYPDAMIICDLGYITTDGNFQSFGGEYEGEVEIGVWFDEFVRYIKISVGNESDTISDFEAEDAVGILKQPAEDSPLSLRPAAHAYKSSGALEAAFSFTDDDTDRAIRLELAEPAQIAAGAESIKLWIYGGTGDSVYAVVRDADGNVHELAYAVTKDYSKQIGWRELTAAVPEHLAGNTLHLETLLKFIHTDGAAGSIVIDDALIYYGKEQEPFLSGLEDHWASEHLNTLYEMAVIQNFDCETVDGELYYDPDRQLTRAEFAKMLVLYTGTNAFPYINEGVTLEADTPYDKVPYIRAAIAGSLMSGRGITDDGTVIFDANAPITREEAFKVIGSILEAEGAELSFTDTAEIAEWAQNEVSKCVGAGVVSGYTDGTLKPKNTITRSEFSAILSKLGKM